MEETIVPIYNPGKIEKKWQRIWADEKFMKQILTIQDRNIMH